MIALLKILSLLILSSCATIQKDIYFKSSDSNLGKISKNGPTPGAAITLEGPSIPNGSSSTNISVVNKSNGVYFFGILVPFIPVFFLGNNQFELEAEEKLTLYCKTWFFKKKSDNRQWYDRDLPCKRIQVIVNNRRFSPVSSDSHGSFIFDLKAASLKEFTIEDVTVDDGRGAQHTYDHKFKMKLESKVHYHIPNIAP